MAEANSKKPLAVLLLERINQRIDWLNESILHGRGSPSAFDFVRDSIQADFALLVQASDFTTETMRGHEGLVRAVIRNLYARHFNGEARHLETLFPEV
ncbi:hypothetical protein HYV74_03405 [Candidatus Uhrbacteria bacterium]|nr:hypothetical protein [Candidatus Uhrbacteria bacterium]